MERSARQPRADPNMSGPARSNVSGEEHIASVRHENTPEPSSPTSAEAPPAYDAATAREEQARPLLATAGSTNASHVSNASPTVEENEPPPRTYDQAMAERPGQIHFGNNNTLNFIDPETATQFLAGNGPIQIGGLSNNRGVRVTTERDARGNTVRTVTFGNNNGGIMVGGIASRNTINYHVSAANHGSVVTDGRTHFRAGSNNSVIVIRDLSGASITVGQSATDRSGAQGGGSINSTSRTNDRRASNSTTSRSGSHTYRMATGQEFQLEGGRSRFWNETELDSSDSSEESDDEVEFGNSLFRFRGRNRGGIRHVEHISGESWVVDRDGARRVG